MDRETPLHGTRVVEAGGWNGVLAGRLLADAGAEVVRIVPPGGDALDAEAPFFGDSGVSIQSTWYNAGKRIVVADPATPGGSELIRALIARADVLIEDWPAGWSPLPGEEIESSNGRLVRVSITPFGSNGPWAGFRTNDLVANALSGSASVSGDPTTPPLTGYGNQSHHTVGFYAAICALAALRAARLTGQPQRVELPAHEALVTCTEQVLMQWFFPEAGNWTTGVAERLGSLHWSKAYEVYTGNTGKGVMVTASLRLVDVLVPWLAEGGYAQDLIDGEKYGDAVALVRDLPNVMRVLREWVEANDAEEIFYEAQRRHLPFGVVWDIATALESPQIAARGYFHEHHVDKAGRVPFPGRFFKTDADGAHPAPPAVSEFAELGWLPREERQAQSRQPLPANRPLSGVRVMDFTHVLAGPFGTRILGDLGAEVLKVGTATRGAGANSTGHPYYMMWNRNKRSLNLNMSTQEGRALARRLAGECDIIIENFRAGEPQGVGDNYGRRGANRAMEGLCDLRSHDPCPGGADLSDRRPWPPRYRLWILAQRPHERPCGRAGGLRGDRAPRPDGAGA
jgi:crotonobetainyl-CoA:carnitine CoA-transferase CaiB-like acyl-CoA transferase